MSSGPSNAPARPSNVPAQLGRYEVICQLGVGGMARVYLAVQRGAVANKLVVLKHLRSEFAHDPQFVHMFVDESRIAVRLNHPNVIHTYEASADSDEHYIVMEFLEGKTLSQLFREVGRENMPLEPHLWVLCEVLAALQYAHELRDFDGTPLEIVHRDVSPSNVFVTRTGDVKLVDFGIAKVTGAISETQQGVIKGKIGYASPEQCLGKPADGRSDLYAVGVMLWEALAGKRRAVGETALAAVQARLQDIEPDITKVNPNVAPELAAIVRKALAFDPDNRYPTAQAFQEDLRAYLNRIGFSSGAPQLGELISERFAAELTELRRVIDEYVGSIRNQSIQTLSNSEIRTLRGAPSEPPPLPEPSRSGGLPRAARLMLFGAAAAGLVFIGMALRGEHAATTPASPPLARGLASSPSPPLASADLAPASASGSDRAPTASSSARPAVAALPRPAARAAKSSTPSTAKTNDARDGRVEPGADLRQRAPAAPARTTRGIDEGDPYQ